MCNNSKVSRRTVCGLVAVSVLPTMATTAEAIIPDAGLIEIGREMEILRLKLDRESDHDAAMNLLNSIDQLTKTIVLTPAQSLEGLYVKARATAWALENDCGLLDPIKESNDNDRLAASIVRDLLNVGSTVS